MQTKTTRLAKVHGQYRRVRHHWNQGRNVAWVNLTGLWLEKAGFNVGDGIEIVVGEGCLLIQKRKADGDR